MKVVVTILKTLGIILLLAALVLAFWFGVFTASKESDLPIPLPAGLLEPPDISVSQNLYKTNDITLNGRELSAALGFPLFSLDCWDENGNFKKDISDISDAYYSNVLEDGLSYDMGYWEPNRSDWNGKDEDFSESILAEALYLFKIASYNEKFATNFAYLTEAGGSADIAGVKGKLMSQSIRWESREQVGDSPVKRYENFFNQQVNAMYEAEATELVKKTAELILNRATRSMGYDKTYYYFNGAASPSFTETADPKVTPDIKQFYEPFLAPENSTVAAGRTSAAWESQVNLVQPQEFKVADYSKYTGLTELDKDATDNGYLSFNQVFSTKFIVKIDSSYFYNEKNATATNRPYVNKIWVDKNGNAVAEDSAEAVRFYYDCQMVANIELVNANSENIAALAGYTGADPVKFVRLVYQFSVWDSGLFRHWHTIEGWDGSLSGLTGVVYPNNPTYYAYSKENTYLEDFLQYMIGEKKAESVYGITYKDGVTYKGSTKIHDTNFAASGFNKAAYALLLKEKLRPYEV